LTRVSVTAVVSVLKVAMRLATARYFCRFGTTGALIAMNAQ
jgi:hypothetical protein